MEFVPISWEQLIELIKVLLLPLFIGAFLFYLRKPIKALLTELAWRMKSSDNINIVSKFASIEIERNRVGPDGSFKGIKKPDKDDLREKHRRKIYSDSRRIQLVHKVSKSRRDGQEFDIEMYVIPHKNSSLNEVSKVEYYFGKYWQKQIYVSVTRYNGFLVSTSAYGTFLCTAEIFFNDGNSVILSRYIDFEMGGFAPISQLEEKRES